MLVHIIKFFIDLQLIYSVLGVQQSDSVIHIYKSILFQILFHCRLLQDTDHSSLLFSQPCLTLRPHGLQHARPPCPSPSPGACSSSCPLSQRCIPTISSSVVPFSSCLQSFPTTGSVSNELTLCIRWPKYWSFSFSISPCNEYSGLISFSSYVVLNA